MIDRRRTGTRRRIHRFPATVVGVVDFAAVDGVVLGAAEERAMVVGVGAGGISAARASSVAFGCRYTGVGAGIMPRRVVAAVVMF